MRASVVIRLLRRCMPPAHVAVTARDARWQCVRMQSCGTRHATGGFGGAGHVTRAASALGFGRMKLAGATAVMCCQACVHPAFTNFEVLGVILFRENEL